MTEKDYNPERRNKKVLVETPKKQRVELQPTQKKEKIAEANASDNKEVINKEKSDDKVKQIVQEKKSDDNKSNQSHEPANAQNKSEAKPSEEKKEEKKPVQKKPIVKKPYAIVNGKDLPISTKTAGAICKFIKNKKIQDAVADLEKVIIKKRAVPMKGEIPHRKGKMMAGRYPKKAAEYFIKLLKNLAANANVNGLEEPIITDGVANIASRPYGRFGRVRKKRTHVKIKCKEKKNETK